MGHEFTLSAAARFFSSDMRALNCRAPVELSGQG
jgi:hypothetical protein